MQTTLLSSTVSRDVSTSASRPSNEIPRQLAYLSPEEVTSIIILALSYMHTDHPLWQGNAMRAPISISGHSSW